MKDCIWLGANKIGLKEFVAYRDPESWVNIDEADKFDILRDKAKRMFNKGERVMVISDKLQIPFQTIYEWKKKNWQL